MRIGDHWQVVVAEVSDDGEIGAVGVDLEPPSVERVVRKHNSRRLHERRNRNFILQNGVAGPVRIDLEHRAQVAPETTGGASRAIKRAA